MPQVSSNWSRDVDELLYEIKILYLVECLVSVLRKGVSDGIKINHNLELMESSTKLVCTYFWQGQ